LKAFEVDMPLEVAAKHRKSRAGNLLLFLTALTPAVYLGWLISATAVNILYADEWGYIFLFRHLSTHTLTLQDMVRQHNESRTTLPNLIELGLGVLTHWDTRWDMGVTFLFACIISLNVYLLSRRTLNLRQGLALWAVANLLIFSTAQSQNWTWGIQMIVFMPIMFITLGMLIAYSRMNVTWKFATCIALATASTFSYANGQLAWVLLLAALLIGSRGHGQRPRWRIGIWGAAFAANMWVYYHDYHAPVRSPSMLLIFKHPIDAIEYFTAFLGASLGQGFHELWVSVAFGVVLLSCLVIGCFYIWRRWRCGQARLLQLSSVWLLVAAYAVASAAVTTAGRLGFGLIYSQDSRYTTFSLYLAVGLLYLGAIIVNDVYRRGYFVSARALAVLGLGLVLIPHISTEIGGVRQMWADRRIRLSEKAFTQLLNLFPSPQGVYMHPHVLIEKDFLNQMGYLSPRLVVSRDLTKIAAPNGGEASGFIDAMYPLNESSWNAMGWGIIPGRQDPAEVVLLAGENGSGNAIAIAETRVGVTRPDVVKITHDHNFYLSGWGVTFKSADVPSGTTIISAWVYDPETGWAYRLGEARPFPG
jgi:hypothetical protein